MFFLSLFCLILLPCCFAIERHIQDRGGGGGGGGVDDDKNKGDGGSVAAERRQ